MACSARRFIRDMRRVLLGSVSTRVYTETPRAGRVEVCAASPSSLSRVAVGGSVRGMFSQCLSPCVKVNGTTERLKVPIYIPPFVSRTVYRNSYGRRDQY